MEEGVRRHRFGKSITDDFAAKMLAEGLISVLFGDEVKHQLPDTNERGIFLEISPVL